MYLPQGQYVASSSDLYHGDRVEPVNGAGILSCAVVDTVADSGEIIWLQGEGNRQSTLYYSRTR